MKNSKQNDTKVTKDALLHQIFQEISDENRENAQSAPTEDLMSDPENTSSKKSGFLKWIFIIIFIIGVVYLWFYTLTEVTQDTKVKPQSDDYTAPKTEQIVQHKEEIILPDILKEVPKDTYTIEEKDTIELIVASPPTIEDTRTERDKAKEALMLQMQN